MRWISKVINLEFNSLALRALLSLYFHPGRYYRIPFGALRGFRIWYDRSINFHAVLGIWEKNNFSILQKVVEYLIVGGKSLVVFDVGANIGLFSLFFSKHDGVRTVAFEAVADTLEVLKNNLLANQVESVQVKHCAISSQDGTTSFYVGHHHKSSLLKDWASDRGTAEVTEVIVPSMKLDSYYSTSRLPSVDLIKIDVEGGADKVFAGADSLIGSQRPLVLIESHNAREDQSIIHVLTIHHFCAFRINNRRWVKKTQANYTDPEGVWGTMLLVPKERFAEFSNVLK